ncbi:MAG TPA: class I SAM-dependent methyltransferase [Saprospiraceae bacterium]|nr:class I SAM-dependent methyltransferase [Saprospiraceae bacterium]
MLKKVFKKVGFSTSWSALNKKLSRKNLYEFLDEEFSQIEKDSQVLSIGAGGGVNKLLNHFAQKQNFSVTSFDIDENRNPDIVGDICSYNFEVFYDVIVICEVLEHVHSPHLAVDNLFRTLKNGGKVILSTPFILPIHESPYDYYRYTKYGLSYLFRSFDEIKIKERNSYFEAINVLRVRFPKNKNKVFLSRLLSLIAYINLPVVLLLSYFFSSDAMTTGYVMTAVKPNK